MSTLTEDRSQRIRIGLVAVIVLGLLAITAGLLFAGLGGGHRSNPASSRAPFAPPRVTTTTVPPPTTTAVPSDVVAALASTSTCTAPPTVTVPKATEVAHLAGNTPGSELPGAPPDALVPGSWYGYPSDLPVISSQRRWLEVREAQRPNQSTAWIPASGATLSTTPYAMVLNLCDAHLMVFQSGQEIYDFPSGIGAPDDPTVTGQYFIAMTVPPPGPGYGAFVLATSAHSDAIQDWDGSGDAIIGIHGPITAYDDSLIGTTGAAISHGCIRLHDSDLAKLSVIPAGTPLLIVG